jgi:hypothetical protein
MVQAMTTQGLCLKAIELNPNCAPAYVNLATTLPQGGSIHLHGQAMTKQGLYLKAIELDPSLALAYVNLATTLPQGGSIELHGQAMTTQEPLSQSY